MANKKSVISEVYKLPTLGKVYGENFPEEVNIRSMTTFEEKMRLGTQGFWTTMCSILDSVVISPEGYDTKQMTLQDFYFLMYKMRVVSYGPEYKATVTCPTCGKTTTYTVNLDELKVDYLAEDYEDKLTIGPLPRSKDVIKCKFIKVYESMNNEKQGKAILAKSPDYVGDPTYILNIASKIDTINGEALSDVEKQLYAENMCAMDSAYFAQAYSKNVDNIGLDTAIEETCTSCGEALTFSLPFNSEFFRPTFDI